MRADRGIPTRDLVRVTGAVLREAAVKLGIRRQDYGFDLCCAGETSSMLRSGVNCRPRTTAAFVRSAAAHHRVQRAFSDLGP
jgi:hypothetical protein